MSKLTRETVEKAEKLLAKKMSCLQDDERREIEIGLERSASLDSEWRQLKEEAKEKRLDIEDNARALARVVRKAKRSAEKAEAALKAEAKAAKKVPRPEQKGPAPKGKASSRRIAGS